MCDWFRSKKVLEQHQLSFSDQHTGNTTVFLRVNFKEREIALEIGNSHKNPIPVFTGYILTM